MTAADLFWVLWALTIVGILILGWRRRRREARWTWIGTGQIGGVPTTIRARFTDSDTPPELEGITWRRP